MGVLDDAIREHLDLKRARGADPAEIERLEREALGPVRREPTFGSTQLETAPRYVEDEFDDDEPDEFDDEPRDPHTEAPDDYGYHDSTAPHQHPHEQYPAPPLSLAGEHTPQDRAEHAEEELPKRRFLRRSRPASLAQPLPAEPLAHDEQLHSDDLYDEHLHDEHFHHEEAVTELHHLHDEHDELPVHDEPAEAPEPHGSHGPPAHEVPTTQPEAAAPPPATDQAPAPPPPPAPPPAAAPREQAPPPQIKFGTPPPPRPRFTSEPPSEEATDDEPMTRAEPSDDAAPAPPTEPTARRVEPQPTREFDVQSNFEAEHNADAEHNEDGDEDVLEETPEFLQDTPEHDRLWFEQRPPRDFDFDG